MPKLNAHAIGDIVYPQYSRVITVSIGGGAIVKGQLYTLDGDDNLVSPGNARGSFIRGLYQAAVTVAAATAGTNTVQVYGAGSRVLLKAPADLHVGDAVEWAGATSVLKAYTPTANTVAADLNAKVGRVYKIYTQSDIGVEKKVTAAGDLVVVELGQG